MDGSTALAILDKKINSVESTVQSVTLGSDKKSIVITTVDGVSFSVSIPNAVDNPTILNKFTVVNGEVYYDGKRIAEYTEIPTTTSQLTNDSGFITSANLPNLTPYQSKNDSDLNTTNKTVVGAINELKTNINNINVPTKTSQLTNDSGYIINSDIPIIPTKVSQLTNDSNYVTQTEMTDAIADAVTGGTVDLTGYQKSSDNNLATTDKTVVGAINELKEDIDNFEGGSGGGEGLTTEQAQQLADAYAHSQITHVQASDIPTNVSQLNNDSGFITSASIPDVSVYQSKSDTTLTTTNKTIVGSINEIKNEVDGITVPSAVSELTNDSGFITSRDLPDTSTLQPKNDTNLQTTNKTVVGAINEVKTTADDKSKVIALTKAEFDALSQKDEEIYYIITDDSTDIVTTIDENSTDKEVPSALATYRALDDKNIYHFSSPTEGDANKLVIKGKSAHYQISNIVMTSGAITNLPVDVGVGGLLISHGLATVHQFFLTHNNRVYKRYGYYNGTDTEVTWVGTWQRVITENDFNETVNGNGGIRIEISENADMNDYTTAGFYKVLSGTVAKTIANLPIQNACLINIYGNSSSATGWMTQEIIADNAITNNRYIRHKVQNNANWSPWEKIVTTSVADVPKTTITFSDTTNYAAFGSSTLNYYIVKNGVCYVSLDISVISKASEWTTIYTLPKPIAIKIDTSHSFVDEVGDSCIGYGVWDDGTLRIKNGENGTRYISNFSYPVAEE